ncbi:MerR family DNA-binding transcriptional regulator [Mycobacterium sp. DBP42]|nr:MerR family DNA-binding transcriptional regulator [Mycobacterium sp. DBP42]
MSGAGLRRGELAAAAGVNIDTLRYYERRGLLREPQRSLNATCARWWATRTLTVVSGARCHDRFPCRRRRQHSRYPVQRKAQPVRLS